MKFSVRAIPATGGYVDSIRWMDRVCFPGEATLSFDGAYWWIAFDEDDIPAAYASVTYFHNGTAFLSRAGVLPGSRGNGLQRRLVRARERQIKTVGYKRIVSYTSKDNIVSGNNLIRCGYKMYKPECEWGAPGCVYWKKKL